MKIFILGGEGFVGSAFRGNCEREGKDCSVIDLDNYDSFRGKECELLINANGNSKKYLARERPGEDFRLSVWSVVKSLEDFKFKKYVYISSVDVYPDPADPDRSREEASVDIRNQSHYGFHKYLAEQLVRHRAPLWLIVRLGGLLGPGLSKNPVFDLLHDVPLRVKEESEYQYISTDRMAEMTFHLIEKEMWGEIFNICGKGTVSLKEIRLWLKKPLRYLGDKVPQERYEVNIEKIGGLFEMPASRDVARDFVFSGLKRTK